MSSFDDTNEMKSFVKKAMSIPLLEENHEKVLAKKWIKNKDEKALHELTQSHIRLVIAFAVKYKNYGLNLSDLIQEGNIGLMKAAERFELDKEVRFSTYAGWWIRASIQDYILKNWSVVKTGSTASQKALFFNLRKIKQQISDASSDFMGQKEINQVSEMLNVKTFEIQNMESRLSGGDVFLNQKIDNDSENDFMSLLEDERANPEESFELTAMIGNCNCSKIISISTILYIERIVPGKSKYDISSRFNFLYIISIFSVISSPRKVA